jgi:hypothetical protein
MTPVPDCLVWVPFGSFGWQLAHLDRKIGDFTWLGHKWRDNSRRWVGPVRIKLLDGVLSYQDVDLVDLVVQRALKAATPGRPPCHHGHHFIPQVKRRAALALAGGAR